jgi:hypothetical protein
MRKSPLHEGAEDVDWSHALHRESVLQPLLTRGSLSNEVVKEAAQTIGISRAHFYRLLAAYKQWPQTSTPVVFSLKKESRTGPCYSKSGLDGTYSGLGASSRVGGKRST